MNGWQWDETLYEGSATHYRNGRLPYPPELPERLAEVLRPRGTERYLDVGAGPGNLTVMLAPLFAETVGLDADRGMVEEAARAGGNIRWVNARIEEFAERGFDVISFGQSFHWINADWVKNHLRDLVTDRGVVVHLGAMTTEGDRTDDPLAHPQPPYDRIRALVREYLGEHRRAGRGTVPENLREDEDTLFPSAGFTPEAVVQVKAGREWERSERQVASAVLSLSSSAPALFGDRFADFERDLHRLLEGASDHGWFSERQSDVTLKLWRAGASAPPPGQTEA